MIHHLWPGAGGGNRGSGIGTRRINNTPIGGATRTGARSGIKRSPITRMRRDVIVAWLIVVLQLGRGRRRRSARKTNVGGHLPRWQYFFWSGQSNRLGRAGVTQKTDPADSLTGLCSFSPRAHFPTNPKRHPCLVRARLVFEPTSSSFDAAVNGGQKSKKYVRGITTSEHRMPKTLAGRPARVLLGSSNTHVSSQHCPLRAKRIKISMRTIGNANNRINLELGFSSIADVSGSA